MRSAGKIALTVIFFILIVCAGVAAWWWQGHMASAQQAPAQGNVYVQFEMEAYDDITQNYWILPGSYENFGNTPELPQLFQLAAQRVTGENVTLATSTRDGVVAMLTSVFSQPTTTAAERQEAVSMLSLVVATLPPQGHDELLASAAQQALSNTVDNTNPSNNLYSDLGLPQGAPSSAVAQASVQKEAALAATTSPAGKAALAQVKQAAQALTNPTDKTIYDQTGAQPTVTAKQLGAHTLYIDISSVAPTTIYELGAALNSASTTPSLDQLVIDLRGNIGGDLGFAGNFLGFFYGPQAYAYDLYHQGQLEAQRTTSDALPVMSQFKEVAVLTDGMTQSTAELIASAMKHDHLATIVGVTTRGWGSVESQYPMKTSIDPSQTYELLLVTYLTVRYDGNPIEGNGVVPDIDVSQTGWQGKLGDYFSSPDIIKAIETEIANPPQEQSS